MAVADGNSQLTAHPGEPILWFLNVHESQTATRASQRVSSQHASKTNTVLPPSLSHLEMVPQMVHCMWQRKKIPIFFFFPAKAYPAASHSQTPGCNLGHPCQPRAMPRSMPETGKGWAAATEVSPENSHFVGGLHSGTKSYEKYE